MSNATDLILAGRGGIIPYKGTTPITATFYGFIPHQDMNDFTLLEHGNAVSVVQAGVTYKEGHYYAARGTYYSGMTMANATDSVDIVYTLNQPQ